MSERKWILPVAGAGVLVIALTISGCVVGGLDPENWVKVRTPEMFRKPGEPAALPLREAKPKFQQVVQSVDRYASDIERGSETVRQFQEFFGSLVGQVETAAGALPIPGSSAMGMGVALLGGWLGLRKPGDVASRDVKSIADADWEDGFRKGLLKAGVDPEAVGEVARESA